MTESQITGCMPGGGAPDRQSPWPDAMLWGLAVVFLLAYGVNFRTNLIGDSQAHLYQAASLAWSGDFDLGEYRERLEEAGGGNLPYFVAETPKRIFSAYSPVAPIPLAPFLIVGGWVFGEAFRESTVAWGLAGKVAGSLMILAAGLVLWAVLRRRARRPAALLALAAFWFGSPLWPSSIDYLQHQP